MVPIHWNDSKEVLKATLKKVNGVLITGGDQVLQTPTGGLSDYTLSVAFILDQAKKLNDGGIYFPVWAICQGFEQLSLIEGKEYGKLVHATSTDIPRKLTFVEDHNGNLIRGRMYQEMSEELFQAMQSNELAYHNNEWRLDPSAYKLDSGLQKYRVLAYSHDRDGRPQVASIEHKYYPIYSHQWHPEKNVFLWKPTLPIPHSKIAVEMSTFTLIKLRNFAFLIFKKYPFQIL